MSFFHLGFFPAGGWLAFFWVMYSPVRMPCMYCCIMLWCCCMLVVGLFEVFSVCACV